MEEEQYENSAYFCASDPQTNNKDKKQQMTGARTRHLVAIIILLAVCLVVSTAAIICVFVPLGGKAEMKQSDEMEQVKMPLMRLNETEEKLETTDVTDEIERIKANNRMLLMKLNETDEKLSTLESQMSIKDEELASNAGQASERLLILETANSGLQTSLTGTKQQQQTILSSLQDLTSDVESYHRLDDKVVNCPSSYQLNPYSQTCIRLIRSSKTWFDAKNYCEDRGENLATFETLESAFWFINLRKSNSDWMDGHVWLGGKRVGGVWKWRGKATGKIDTVPWGFNQPVNLESPQHCLVSWRDDQYTYHDRICTLGEQFACEKIM